MKGLRRRFWDRGRQQVQSQVAGTWLAYLRDCRGQCDQDWGSPSWCKRSHVPVLRTPGGCSDGPDIYAEQEGESCREQQDLTLIVRTSLWLLCKETEERWQSGD